MIDGSVLFLNDKLLLINPVQLLAAHACVFLQPSFQIYSRGLFPAEGLTLVGSRS